jgi:hypothetical protein
MNVKTRMALLVSTLGAAATTLAIAPLAQAAAPTQADAKAQRADRSQSAVPDLARVVSTMNITAIPN